MTKAYLQTYEPDCDKILDFLTRLSLFPQFEDDIEDDNLQDLIFWIQNNCFKNIKFQDLHNKMPSNLFQNLLEYLSLYKFEIKELEQDIIDICIRIIN